MTTFLKFRPAVQAFAVACFVAGAVALSPAAAQSDPAERAFAMLTNRMEPARKVQFCAFVAEHALMQAEAASTPELQISRETEAGRLKTRLAPHLERANASLTEADLQRIEGENNEYMGLLSFTPSRSIAKALNESGEHDDFLWLWLAEVSGRCDAMFDGMGYAKAAADK